MEHMPSSGILLQYSLTVNALVAELPIEPADGSFVTIGCVKDVPNFGNIEQLMAEHKCLDATEQFVKEFPTGFLKSENTTIKVAFERALYQTLDGFVSGHTELTYRLKYALLPSESINSKSVRTGFLQKISDAVKSDGTEVEADFVISWSSRPKFTPGS